MNLFCFWSSRVIITFLGSHVLASSRSGVSNLLFFNVAQVIYSPFFGYVVYSNHVSVISWLFCAFLTCKLPLK